MGKKHDAKIRDAFEHEETMAELANDKYDIDLQRTISENESTIARYESERKQFVGITAWVAGSIAAVIIAIVIGLTVVNYNAEKFGYHQESHSQASETYGK